MAIVSCLEAKMKQVHRLECTFDVDNLVNLLHNDRETGFSVAKALDHIKEHGIEDKKRPLEEVGRHWERLDKERARSWAFYRLSLLKILPKDNSLHQSRCRAEPAFMNEHISFPTQIPCNNSAQNSSPVSPLNRHIFRLKLESYHTDSLTGIAHTLGQPIPLAASV
ncbi:hypothetical protein TIFTF001_031199 [Ficus carica]|uniref:Uncharacterized protein n=1 Tax=Ficus carica TaxID=3494 RepID=A0AA88DUX7_FICCA|nr:hypothetical protein TIFTF001_031199 [Ficus carica]